MIWWTSFNFLNIIFSHRHGDEPVTLDVHSRSKSYLTPVVVNGLVDSSRGNLAVSGVRTAVAAHILYPTPQAERTVAIIILPRNSFVTTLSG